MIKAVPSPDEDSEDENHPYRDVVISEEKKVLDERKKVSLAPTFDRLVEVNMALTLAVDQLVKVSYVALFVEMCLVLVMLFFIVKK